MICAETIGGGANTETDRAAPGMRLRRVNVVIFSSPFHWNGWPDGRHGALANIRAAETTRQRPGRLRRRLPAYLIGLEVVGRVPRCAARETYLPDRAAPRGVLAN